MCILLSRNDSSMMITVEILIHTASQLYTSSLLFLTYILCIMNKYIPTPDKMHENKAHFFLLLLSAVNCSWFGLYSMVSGVFGYKFILIVVSM